MSRLPVIDFSGLGVDKSDDKITDQAVSSVGKDIITTFSSIGFVYLSHCGVDSSTIEQATKETERFFNLPNDIKEKYTRLTDNNHGWVKMEMESLNPERPGDLKEAYNVTPLTAKVWPDAEIPELRRLSGEIVDQCDKLMKRILWAMAVGLELKDPYYFVKAHLSSSRTTLRYLKYPSLSENTKPGQIRCGEHSDYGSITLLFQDDIGGLQLLNKTGEWIDATPVPGAVLVNIGDLMQRWTSDKLVSNKHRVIIPEEEFRQKQSRRSMAYFGHPADDVMITCIDGSDKYEPINSLDYLNMRFAATYY